MKKSEMRAYRLIKRLNNPKPRRGMHPSEKAWLEKRNPEETIEALWAEAGSVEITEDNKANVFNNPSLHSSLYPLPNAKGRSK